MARRPGTWDIHVSHHSATGGAAWLGGDALGRTRGESWIRQHPGFRQRLEKEPPAGLELLPGWEQTAQQPSLTQGSLLQEFMAPGNLDRQGGEWRRKKPVRLQLGGCPTSTTDLLGDLGQLASPAWVSVSSSVN